MGLISTNMAQLLVKGITELSYRECASKKDGKGYEYPAMGHVVGLEGKIQGDRKRLLHMARY